MSKTIEHQCECGDCTLTFNKLWNSPKRFFDAKHREAWRRKQPKIQPKRRQLKCGFKESRKVWGESESALNKTYLNHKINRSEKSLQG